MPNRPPLRLTSVGAAPGSSVSNSATSGQTEAARARIAAQSALCRCLQV